MCLQKEVKYINTLILSRLNLHAVKMPGSIKYKPTDQESSGEMAPSIISAVLSQSYLPLSLREGVLEALSVNRDPVS